MNNETALERIMVQQLHLLSQTIDEQLQVLSQVTPVSIEKNDASISQNSQPFPLTEAQQQLWALAQLGQEGALAYNIHASLQLDGALQLERLQQALEYVVQRHQALRTVINVDGQTQMTLAQSAVNLPLEDFSQTSGELQHQQIMDWMRSHSFDDFDFAQPMVKLHLLKLNDQQHILVLAAHHIMLDGWSLSIVLRDIANEYSALCQNQQLTLPTAQLFSEYVNWRQATINEADQQYWLQHLSGDIPSLNLPGDRPRPTLGSYQGGRQTVEVALELSQALSQWATTQGCTRFMLFFAIYLIWLHRLSGQSQIVVGIPTMGRPAGSHDNLVGYCAHLLPILSDYDPTQLFVDYLQTIKTRLLAAYEHDQYPFARLLTQLERDLSAPLISTIFNLDRPAELPQMFDLSLSWYPQPITHTAFDINFNMTALGQQLVIDFDYSQDIINPETAQRWLQHYITLAQHIQLQPQQAVGDISLLSTPQWQQLVVDWNQSAITTQYQISLSQLFDQQARLTPDAMALIFADQTLSYQQLQQRVNQLSNHLLVLGIVPQQRLGICLERCPDLLVGLLAILRIGATYVPLDPDYPPQRLQYMLADAGIEWVLSKQPWLEQLPVLQGLNNICFDRDQAALARCAVQFQYDWPQPEAVAYIIYTSGSTGKPKGVQIPHQALSNFLQSMQQQPGVNATDNVLAITTISFDIAGLELYLPLISGATVVLLSREMAMDANLLAAQITQHDVNVMQATPATWQMLVNADWPGHQTLKILVGGEALSRQLAQQLLSRCSELWNVYGPTETTIWSSCYQVSASSVEVLGTAEPIGKPLANTQFYIVDQQLQPVPLGVAGELLIGGIGLATGYLNRPELTNEKFIYHSLAQTASRLYRTNDLVRYLTNGDVEYLGRLDHQLKVRGFRIELGEIEATLAQHDAVLQVVVVPTDYIAIDKRLLAYLTVNTEDTSAVIKQLKQHAEAQLPDYMLPADYIVLTDVPLTPAGKIDRNALQQQAQKHTVTVQNYIAPRDADEALLAEMMMAVLAVTSVGMEDNFFALGGHSLLATQLLSRIRQTFQVQLSLRQLFEHATCAKLAVLIREQTVLTDIPELVSVTRQTPLPLSFAQQRLWFLYQLEDKTAATYNMSGAVKLIGSLNVAVLRQSLLSIVKRHEILRAVFKRQGVEPILELLDPYDPMIYQTANQTQLSQLLNTDAQAAFDLEVGPLFRVLLIQLADDQYVISLNMHHIIADGWSIGILFAELSALYKAFLNQENSPLVPLTVQYIDYAYWQQACWKTQDIQSQLQYWQDKMADAPELLALPTDKPRPPVQYFAGDACAFECSASLSQQLKQIAQQHDATLFMVLYTALVILLSRYSGDEDIVVGAPAANRTHPDIEPLIGLFANFILLRCDLTGNLSFQALLQRNRDMIMQAYRYQDIPFEKLVEVLKPKRNLSYTPLFQVALVFQNERQETLTLPGLHITSLPPETTTAPYDLLLAIEETKQGLRCEWVYNTDLFMPATMQNFATHYQQLLTEISANPTISILDIPLGDDVSYEKSEPVLDNSEEFDFDF